MPAQEHRLGWRQLGLRVGVLLGAALVALNVYDAATTLYVLRLGGEELNPIMGGLLAVSPYVFLAFKTVGVCVVVTGILANWDLKIARAGTVFLAVFYTLVALWNTIQVML